MRRGSRKAWAAIAVTLLLSGIPALTCAKTRGKGGAAAGDVGVFRQALEDDGLIVQEGKPETFDVLGMYDAGITPSCRGNNAQAPYMSHKLPMAPLQRAPSILADAPIKPENRGLRVDYRLRPDEGVVFIGKAPPACVYFSYINYLYTRCFPEERQARRIFGSLGDSVSNLTINTAGTPGGGEGDVFESGTAIITTADAGTERRVRESLAAAGYPVDMVDTNVIPFGPVRMGLEKKNETFAIVHRAAFFEDHGAGRDYMAAARGTVLRLTPGDARQPEPFGAPRCGFGERGTPPSSSLRQPWRDWSGPSWRGAADRGRQSSGRTYGCSGDTMPSSGGRKLWATTTTSSTLKPIPSPWTTTPGS